MERRIRTSVMIVPASVLVLNVLLLNLASPWMVELRAQQPQPDLPLTSPHAEGKYVGLTKCAACHFDQYKDWKGSQHNLAFEILPAKYRNDATCLECHTTAVATDIGSHQFGVSCESCHGPGGEHAKLALQLINEVISEEALTSVRGKIHRVDMLQCVNCHVSKAHKKHPPYDRDELTRPRASTESSGSFFRSVHAPASARTSAGPLGRSGRPPAVDRASSAPTSGQTLSFGLDSAP